MDKEYLNKKWIEGGLTDEEQTAFEAIDDNQLLKQIVDKAPAFSASNFSEVKDFEVLKSKIQSKNQFIKKRSWLKPMLRIASVFVIAIGIYSFFFLNNSTSFETTIGEKRMVLLPDASEVTLNAVSEITYNEKAWADNRELKLDGEAFFKVEKGSTFDVITTNGKITVLGTQFNVKQRENLFEVSCFEGLVAVTYGKETMKLLPGNSYSIANGKAISDVISNKKKPYWIDGTSYFKKAPFYEVINELERQYKVVISVNQKDENLLFTGGFTHKNIEQALKSISAPLKLVYIMESPTIISLRHSE